MKIRSSILRWFLAIFICQITLVSRADETNSTSYLRVAHPDTNTVELQIALKKFVPEQGKGPAIWLTAASHIGETNYYAALQKHLDAQTLVLFEGISPRRQDTNTLSPEVDQSSAVVEKNSAKSPAHQSKNTHLGNLQTTFARSLGLVFQLEAINYERSNFQNSDLSVTEIRNLLEAEPENPKKEGTVKSKGQGSKEFDQLVQAMSGDSWLGTLMNWALQFIGSNRKLQAMTKVVLIEMLGQLDGDFSNLKAAPPDLQHLLTVLIQERNKKVYTDRQTALKTMKEGDSVSVFFGAGHMSGLEERITKELKYRPDEEVWLKVFSVNKKEVGMTDQEVQSLQLMIQTQMKFLQSGAAQETNSVSTDK